MVSQHSKNGFTTVCPYLHDVHDSIPIFHDQITRDPDNFWRTGSGFRWLRSTGWFGRFMIKKTSFLMIKWIVFIWRWVKTYETTIFEGHTHPFSWYLRSSQHPFFWSYDNPLKITQIWLFSMKARSVADRRSSHPSIVGGPNPSGAAGKISSWVRTCNFLAEKPWKTNGVSTFLGKNPTDFS